MVRSSLASFLTATALVCVPASASVIIYDQSPQFSDLSTLESRNSNTVTNPHDQQVADDFMVQTGGLEVTQLDVWFTYRDVVVDQIDGSAPPVQNMLVQIFDDSNGDPGNVVYSANVSFTPVAIGETNGFFTPNEVYVGEIMLATPFSPDAGVRYWLSPLGSDDSVTWQWQLSSDSGERRSRGGAGGSMWRRTSLAGDPLEGDFAFAMHIIPEPSGLVLMATFFLGAGLRRRRS